MKYDPNAIQAQMMMGPHHQRQTSAQKTIAYAARLTGGDFGHLMRTAARESNFDVKAKNPNSSAAGMFQFIEQTWLATIKQHGDKHGLSAYADMIQRKSNGHYYVPDREARKNILNLRHDSHVAAVMAAEHSKDNARYMASKLGRQPHSGELYAAHFLGMGGAVKLIKAVERNPDLKATDLFPAAARANKPLFYDRGRPVSVAGLYENLTRKGQGGYPTLPADTAPVSEPKMMLADLGGGASRRGVDPLNAQSRLQQAVLSSEQQGRESQLASLIDRALSPTWAQILTAENGLPRGRKLFG